MPRFSVDYSKTVVYSITAPDGSVFVNHTTNLTQRKAHLKLVSTNLDCSDEESKFIKASGGFLAVKIAPVKSVDAKSAIEAKIASEEVRKELVKVSNPNPTPRKYRKVPVIQVLKDTPAPEPFKLLKPEVVLEMPVPIVLKPIKQHKVSVPKAKFDLKNVVLPAPDSADAPAAAPDSAAAAAPATTTTTTTTTPDSAPKRGRPKKAAV